MGWSSGRRRAASLTEVLIALVILTIGLTSVIALFPVGVNRVRNATLDTRTTIVASNANALFHLKRMANDPALVDLAAYDVISTTVPTAAGYIFDDPVRNPLAFTAWSPNVASPNVPGNWHGGTFPTDHAASSMIAAAYATFQTSLNLPITLLDRTPEDPTNVVNWNADFRERLIAEDDDVFGLFAGGVDRTDVQEVASDYNYSYPVLLDPYLYDAMCFQFGLLGASGFTGGVPRINIATALTRSDSTTVVPGFENYYGSTLFTGTVRPFADIAVLSLSEITLLPAAAVSIDRETVKARWFASSADINYATDVPGQPTNPSSQDYLDTSGSLTLLTPNNYIEPVPINMTLAPSLSNPIRPTAIRDYEYTWAAMIQRRLVAPPEGGITDPTVARPNLVDREFKGKLAILCFYRRNLQQPYRVIEGCFYTGSRVATLSWPSNLPAPTINVGTWLCEASISRSTATTSLTGVNPDPLLGSTATLSGVYVGNSLAIPPNPVVDFDEPTLPAFPARRIYRRSFSFHRVTAVNEPVDLPDGRTYVQATLERPAVGFPLEYRNPASPLLVGAQSGQDDRPIDPYPALAGNPKYPAWPIIDSRSAPATLSLGTNDETNCSQADAVGIPRDQYSFYYPVIIFDGLREVFEYNAE
jgi:hypothetical protein